MKEKLAVIILTYNEEIHIERCISSVQKIADSIFVIDSFSNDKTAEISKKLGAKVYQHKWPGNHAEQLNWALENIDTKCEWIFRIDADEYITNELSEEILLELSNKSDSINGFILKRRVYFLGKWMKNGMNYPIKLLRIWKNGEAICENRRMDEHMVLLKGNTKELKKDFIDENLRDITWWIEKHNGYATKEMIETLIKKYIVLENQEKKINIGLQGEIKRKIKNFYQKFPLFLRPLIYFNYRYFIRLGFLDGKEGLVWNFLQGFWYRFLVDTKIYEYEKKLNFNKRLIREKIKKEFL